MDSYSEAQQEVLSQMEESPEDGFNPPEAAHKLTYNVETNTWEKTETSLAVGKKMFAWGSRQGCILVQDKNDNQIYVIKKPFDEGEAQKVYEDVKMEAIAELMAECYNAREPPLRVQFVPTFVYILAQRPKQPAVRAEPLLFNHDKAKLRSRPNVTPMELDTLEAFELFTYEESECSFIVVNPSKVGEYWTEPDFHSTDRGIGGERNRGAKAINLFLLRHRYNDICKQISLKNPSTLQKLTVTKEMGNRAVWNDEVHLPTEAASMNLDQVREDFRGAIDASVPKPQFRPKRMPGRPVSEQAPISMPITFNEEAERSVRFGDLEPEEASQRPMSLPVEAPTPQTAAPPKEPRPGKTGLQLEEENDGRVLVSEILPGSPAALTKIQVGDELVTVDGASVYGKSFKEVAALMKGMEGTSVVLELRDGVGKYSTAIPRQCAQVVKGRFVKVPEGADPLGRTYSLPFEARAMSLFDDGPRTITVPHSHQEGVFEKEEDEAHPMDERHAESTKKRTPPPPQRLTDEKLVGLLVKARIGLSVEMSELYMSQGKGVITYVNERRGFCTVQWDSGRLDKCLYCGGGGDYYLKLADGASEIPDIQGSTEPKEKPVKVLASSVTEYKQIRNQEYKVKGSVLINKQAYSIAKTLVETTVKYEEVSILAYPEDGGEHYMTVIAVDSNNWDSVMQVLTALEDELQDDIFAIKRPAKPTQDISDLNNISMGENARFSY